MTNTVSLFIKSKGHCTFGDVTVELCKKFREYPKKLKTNKTKDIFINSEQLYQP